MKRRIVWFGSSRGQGLTEYAVVLSLVAVAAIGTAALFGKSIRSRFSVLTAAIAGEDKAKLQGYEKAGKSAAAQAVRKARVDAGMGIGEEFQD